MIINPYRFAGGGGGGGGGDPYWANVVLLLHCDGTNGSTSFPDSSNSAHTVTAHGDAAVTTAEKKFGIGSVTCDGTGDYLSVPASSDFSFGILTDFSIEFWMNVPTAGAGADGSGIALMGNSLYVTLISGSLYFGNGVVNMVIASYAGKYGAWCFVHARRSGSTFELFLDGVSQGTYGTSAPVGNTAELDVGYAAVSGAYGECFIDDLRITNGVARPNVVPTAAFPNS